LDLGGTDGEVEVRADKERGLGIQRRETQERGGEVVERCRGVITLGAGDDFVFPEIKHGAFDIRRHADGSEVEGDGFLALAGIVEVEDREIPIRPLGGKAEDAIAGGGSQGVKPGWLGAGGTHDLETAPSGFAVLGLEWLADHGGSADEASDVMPCAPHAFVWTDGAKGAAGKLGRDIRDIWVVLPPDIVVNLEAEDGFQAFVEVGRMRVGTDAGRVDKPDDATGGLTQAGEYIHFLTSGLAIQGIKIAEDLEAGLRGIGKTGADAIEVDLDVAIAAVAGVFDDVEEEFLRLRMVGNDPVGRGSRS
jgi:hypothetical protein